MFLLGLNLSPFKRVLFALQNFDGVGPATAQRLMNQAAIHRFCRVGHMTDRHMSRLKELLQPMLEARRQDKLMRIKLDKAAPRPILPHGSPILQK